MPQQTLSIKKNFDLEKINKKKKGKEEGENRSRADPSLSLGGNACWERGARDEKKTTKSGPGTKKKFITERKRGSRHCSKRGRPLGKKKGRGLERLGQQGMGGFT